MDLRVSLHSDLISPLPLTFKITLHEVFLLYNVVKCYNEFMFDKKVKHQKNLPLIFDLKDQWIVKKINIFQVSKYNIILKKDAVNLCFITYIHVSTMWICMNSMLVYSQTFYNNPKKTCYTQ